MQHSFGRRNAGAVVRLAPLFLGGLLVALGLASPASAGDGPVDPILNVDTECVDGQGAIIVTLMDGSYPASYDINIDSVLVGDDVGEGTYTYTPYSAGDYEVEIRYLLSSGQPYLYDDTWTVEDCGDATSSTTAAPTTAAPTTAAPTTAAPTTAAPTTAAPTTAAPTTSAGSGAAVPTTVASNAAAALPATGRASGNLALIAVLLTAVGGALLLVVRQARRA